MSSHNAVRSIAERSKLFVAGVAATCLCVLAGSGRAMAQDPLVVNAKTIKLKMENARVRVLEAHLAPGDKEAMHSHPAYLFYVIAGGKIRNHAVDGKTTETELKTGDVIYREPVTHWAENIGDTHMHLILVELKEEARTAATPGPR